MPSQRQRQSSKSKPSPIPWVEADLTEYVRGLVAADLTEDIGAQVGPWTLLAPTRAAFRRLPLSLERLLCDPQLVEARFDFFEYTVVAGIHLAQSPKKRMQTLQGRELELGDYRVVGRYGAANVLRSFVTDALVVHVIDGLVYPAPALRWPFSAR